MNTSSEHQPSSRDRLLAAGQVLFHQRGYGAVGLNEILTKASVPKGSFYHHFKSKEEFGRGVIEAFGQKALDELERHLSSDKPPLARLRSFFEGQRHLYVENDCHAGCLLGNLGQELADSSELLRQHIGRILGGFVQRTQACLEEAQERGELPTDTDTELLADVILSSWHGALIRMKVQKDLSPVDAFLRFHLPASH